MVRCLSSNTKGNARTIRIGRQVEGIVVFDNWCPIRLITAVEAIRVRIYKKKKVRSHFSRPRSTHTEPIEVDLC
jgi:hypothetical protein